MRVLMFLAVALVLMQHSVLGGEMSEQRAVQLVRELPEFVAYAKTRECVFDDNELITDRSGGRLPADITLPAWRIDVHTVIDDEIAKHLSLWHRFIISASGQIWVWRMPPADDFIQLDQWRKNRKT